MPAPVSRAPAWRHVPSGLRLVAQAQSDARAPLDEDAIAARFQGRSTWKTPAANLQKP